MLPVSPINREDLPMKLHGALFILVLTLIVPLASHAADVTIEKVPYGGWENNLRLTDGKVEVIITLDVGPRILRYAEVGGENVFWEKISFKNLFIDYH